MVFKYKNKSKEELQLEAMKLLHEEHRELSIFVMALADEVIDLEKKVEHLRNTL